MIDKSLNNLSRHQRAAFLLFISYSIIPLILSEEHHVSDPVDVLSLKHIHIDGYHGELEAEMLVLFKNVETLELRQCNFTTLHENILHSLPNLRKISVSNSVILKEVHEDIESCCHKLKEMEFISSGIFPIPWGQIGDDWPLESLSFSKEKCPELEANILVDKKLKHLTLEYSELEKIDEGAFNGVNHLETLNLQGNKIKEITKAILAPLKGLKVLNLSENLLEELTADQIPHLPNLEKLDIGHNPIKKLDIVAIKKLLPKLTTLDISGIENIVLPKLEDLGNLTLVKHSVL